MASKFDPAYDDLPDEIPIFPLSGALLLPHGQLPLNIFEPRYLAMIRAALASRQRLIGMVQPRETAEAASGDMGAAEVYPTGCAGRIIQFHETDDGRYIITLKGVCRFDIAGELPKHHGYRRVRPDFSAYRGDLQDVGGVSYDRDRLLKALKVYFHKQGIEADWQEVEESADARLITSLAMVCPFRAEEKQALLEASDLRSRADMLISLMEMALMDQDPQESGLRH